jgi:hypothetical protein
MTKLTVEQIAFLDRHGISIAEVYDATGMRTQHYTSDMKLLEMRVAIGVTPCKEKSHRMRNRSGRCVQCNPASFAFEDRYNRDAFVYIAGSLKKKIIKVGYSQSSYEREEILNQLGYGNARDWKLLFHVKCRRAGEVENKVHRKLERYGTQITYLREGCEIDCLELFACSYALARSALDAVLDNSMISNPWECEGAVGDYDFPAVEGHGFFRKGNQR